MGPTAVCATALAWLAACGPSADHKELNEANTYEPIGREVAWKATDAERFGVSAGDFGGAAKAGATEPMSEASLTWATPTGWTELAPKQFRDVNLRVAGDERAECYVTTLGGTAGGLESNINRWRSQMSLGPLDAAAIAALPTTEWLHKPAVRVDFEGTWTGMAGDAAGDGWRLVGLLIVEEPRSRFLKMVGPRAVIAAQLEAFAGLVASFHEGGAHEHAHEPAAQQAPAQAPQAAPPPQVPPTEASGMFAWTAPAGWKQGPAKMMREVTFFSGESGEVECYVALLAGDGGGLLSNINRWCGQLGAPTLSEADAAALKREKVLGVDTALVELARGPDATAPANQEYLLGALCMLPGNAVFVKMTGPRAAVEAQRTAFLEFSRSLRTAK